MAKIIMTTTDDSNDVVPHAVKETHSRISIVVDLAKPIRDDVTADFDDHMYYVPTSDLFGVEINTGDTENG